MKDTKADIVITLDHGASRGRPRLQVFTRELAVNDIMVYETDTEAFGAAMAITGAFRKFGKVVTFTSK